MERRDPGVHFESQITSQETFFLVLSPEQARAVIVAFCYFEHVEHFAPSDPFFVQHISPFLETLLMMTLHCLNPLNHHKLVFFFQKIPAQIERRHLLLAFDVLGPLLGTVDSEQTGQTFRSIVCSSPRATFSEIRVWALDSCASFLTTMFSYPPAPRTESSSAESCLALSKSICVDCGIAVLNISVGAGVRCSVAHFE